MIRKSRGLTQAALSDATGISQPNISHIESGRHNPHLDTLTKIAEALGVHVKELFDDPDYDQELGKLVNVYSTLSAEQRKRLLSFLEILEPNGS